MICGVGRKDNFGNFFEERIRTLLVTTNAFEKISIITDEDDREVADICISLSEDLSEFLQIFMIEMVREFVPRCFWYGKDGSVVDSYYSEGTSWNTSKCNAVCNI